MTSDATLGARLRALVWNRAERRPTAPVRLAVGLLLVGLVLAVVQVGLGLVLATAASPLVNAAALLAVYAALGGATLVAAVLVDRRRVADLGLDLDRAWWADAAFGLLLGAALMTGVFLLAWAAGWVRITGTFVAGAGAISGFLPQFLFATTLFVAVGVVEELVLRGWLLTNVAEGLRGWLGRRWAVAAAVALTSGLFGLLHAGNPNATAASVAGITLAGGFLAAGYVLTGDLAIPVGVHVTWNLFQGPVFGFAVSGLDLGVHVVTLAEQGPDLVTGGAFGPEAGLLGAAASLAGTALVALYVRRRRGTLGLADGLTTPTLRRPRD